MFFAAVTPSLGIVGLEPLAAFVPGLSRDAVENRVSFDHARLAEVDPVVPVPSSHSVNWMARNEGDRIMPSRFE